MFLKTKKIYSDYEKIIYKLMLDKTSKKQEKKNSDNKN